MRFQLPALVLGLGIQRSCASTHADWGRVAVLSCAVYLSELPWEYECESGFYDQLCGYEPAFGSWSNCIHEQLLDVASEAAVVKSLDNVNECCSQASAGRSSWTLDEYYSSLYNASRYMRPEPEPGTSLWYPVEVGVVSRRRFNEAYRSYLSNFDNSGVYSSFLCWYFAVVMGLAVLVQLARVRPWLCRFPAINYLRGKYILPTLARTHAGYMRRGWLIRGLVPTKLETLLLGGFLLVHTVALCYNYHIDPYDLVFPSHSLQWLRLVGDRAAILSFAQFPIIVLFSTRNSTLEHWTGFKYTTSIVMHKWVGRCMVIDAMLHGFAYKLYADISTPKASTSSQPFYWKIGVWALYVSLVMCLLSLGIVRQHHYETFLYIHIALAALFFYFCWLHVKQFGWKGWIYTSLGLWALERLQRLRSILRFGIAKAQLDLVGTDLIKMKVPRPHNWQTQPSQYVFVYFLYPTICWQSHPFTFIDLGDDLLIVIRAKQGATGVLLRELIRQGGHATLKVLIEGPYGSPSPLQRFQRSLFLCGGSGLPGPLAYALQMGQPLEESPCKTFHIVVATRSHDILEAYMDQLSRLRYLNVDLQVYLTGGFKPSHGSIDSVDKQLLARVDFAAVYWRRPDVGSIIKSLNEDTSSLAICCCGPPAFVDTTRNYAAEAAINNSTNQAEYFEEFQTW